MTNGQTLHATAIVFQDIGLLIRGRSGAGKSLLALELLRNAALTGKKAFLVADDRVLVRVVEDGLEMAAPAQLAGRIELRGFGIVSRPHVERAGVHLVVDLLQDYERMPDESRFSTRIENIWIARCPLPERALIDPGHQLLLLEEAMTRLGVGERMPVPPLKTA